MKEAQLTREDLQKNIGYGFGTTIGYTEDGMVFIVSDTKNEEGRPMQTMIEVTPDRATQISTSLIKAAQRARKQQPVKKNGG